MSTDKDVKIPKAILDEIRAMVHDADDEAVLAYARRHRAILKGFRLSRESVPAIKKRIASSILPDRMPSTSLATLAGEDQPGTVLLSILSETVVDFLFEDLLVVCGEAKLLAAMLISQEESIHELAKQYLAESDGVKLQDMESARQRVLEVLLPFFNVTQEWLTDHAATLESGDESKTADRDLVPVRRNPEMETRLSELEDLLKKSEVAAKKESIKQNKRLTQANDKIQRLRHELGEVQKQVSEEQKKRKDLKTALNKSHSDLKMLAEETEGRICEEVAQRLDSAMNRWMRPLSDLDQAVAGVLAGKREDPLIARSERALAEQAQRDQHSGNIAVLRERLDQLQVELKKVRHARVQSLHPLPELQGVEEDLSHEVSRLSSLIGFAGEPDPFVENMEIQINSAPTVDALTRLKQLVEELGNLGAVPPVQLQSLYAAYHRRMSLLYAAFTPKVVKKKHDSDDPVWRLKRAVQENEDLIVILDGHNVLHLLPNLFGDVYENNEPLKRAREKLVQITVQIVRNAAKCRAEIVFDGPSFSQSNHAENVREVYSGGGQGEHRADKYIIEYLEYCCREMSAMPRILVSDDRELRSKAAEFCATYMPVPQFGAFLQEMVD